jgi:hypothetical protein
MTNNATCPVGIGFSNNNRLIGNLFILLQFRLENPPPTARREGMPPESGRRSGGIDAAKSVEKRRRGT